MRQTILDCETGQIYDNTDDPDADDFCWDEINQLDKNTIVVQGCYWGAGYEYKFFDFTNLSRGWPELKVEDFVVDKSYTQCYSQTQHTVENDILTIKSFEHYDEEDEPIDLNIIIKLHRQDNLIKMVDLTLSEKQKQKEYDRDIKKKEEDLKKDELRNNNTFYQHLVPVINTLGYTVCDGYTVRDDISLYTNTFNINIYYKKSKACIISFKPNLNVELRYYDWKCYDNNLNLQFNQDISVIDDIVIKIKELLPNF